jgi:hypothetical protein
MPGTLLTSAIEPTPGAEPTHTVCVEVELDFNSLKKGEYVDSQYRAFRLTLVSASGGEAGYSTKSFRHSRSWR